MKTLWLLSVVSLIHALRTPNAECGICRGTGGGEGALAGFCPGLTVSLDTCSACWQVDREVHLCEAHATEERLVCGREAARLKAKAEPDRLAALDALAALAHAHANAPSEKVVGLIASALEDESYPVREHATRLLGPPQHAEAVLSELTKALAAAEKQRVALDKAALKVREKLRQKNLLDAKKSALLDDLNGTLDDLKDLEGWRNSVLNQLAAIPDDRAVDAICRLTPRDLVLGGSEALVRLGSRPSMNAFLDGMKAWELEHGALESQSLEVKLKAQLVLIEVGRFLLEKEVARVKSGAVPAGSVPPVSVTIHLHEAWSRWLQEHLDQFPEHLPGVTATW